MRLRVLGPIEAGDAAGLGPRDRVVLAALAVRPGDALNAEVLADALWGERPPASWSKVVQGCISRLRRVLGADLISTTSAGYRLTPVDSDRDEFEALAARGREYLATGTPERAVSRSVRRSTCGPDSRSPSSRSGCPGAWRHRA